ncbi:hypothetical protein PanWU01x14_257230 [Parasponia andersonii]|uniref:Uncharacterized protein n=1 Tax=Parasponia andersonii TaxID=3476 RepID=A0A2P5B9Z2_PARAD|nr:hypothetical protein PanWU01x14_257230 [Parasponia andersonii]
MASYPYPCLPIWEGCVSSDETRGHKRLNRVERLPESGSSNTSPCGGGASSCNNSNSSSSSTSSLNSLPRLRFRDHIWTYTHRYLAVEAVEEAAATMTGADRENNDHKRMKRAISIPIPKPLSSTTSPYIGGGTSNSSLDCRISSGNSLNGRPRPSFRDHIRTYTQRYLAAAEAAEETEAMKNTEESAKESCFPPSKL